MKQIKLLTLLAAVVCAANMWAWSGSGTSSNPYLIQTASDWNTLATNVNNGTNYAGKFFKQTANISVTTHVGYYESNSSYRTFNGTYDGGGYTLTVTYSSRYRCAPFEMVDGATIKNLHTAGTITTGSQDASGLIGCIKTGNNTTNIINCRSSVVINSSTNGDGTHAGFIGITRTAQAGNDGGAQTVNITGCIFDGQLNGSSTHSSGGFIGWAEGTSNSYTIKDCIFAPSQVTMSTSNSCTFARSRNSSTLHFINCYYTQTFGTAQGSLRHSITGTNGATITGLGTVSATYNVSGITAYAHGIKYNNTYYGGNGEAISLSLSGSSNYKASSGTLSGSGNSRTLTMPSTDVTIYGAASLNAPTAKSLTYTGTAQALVNAGSAGGGTIQYKLGNGSWETSIPSATNAGTYTVYYRVVGDGTHADNAGSSVSVTINKAALTCRADNKSIDYNSNPPTYTATYSGWKHNETASVLSGTLSFACSYAKGSNAGSYTITPSGVTASNYNITFQTGTLTVNKINPVVTPPTAMDGLEYTGSEQTLVNTGSTTGGTLQYAVSGGSWSTSLPTATAAGSHTVYYKVVGNTNYNDVTQASVNVTIGKAALSITADNKSVTYGDAAPTYTAVYSGWVNGETQAVLGGTLNLACTYAAGSNVGDYTITPSGVTAINYEIAFVPGTLTVNKADAAVVSAPADLSNAFNGAAQTLISAGSAIGGEMQYSFTSGSGYSADLPQAMNIGNYTIYYKVVGDGNHNDVDEVSITATIVAGTSYEIPDDVDYSDVLAGLNGQTLNVTINRKLLRNGDYNTLCLPFDLSTSQLHNASNPLYGCTVSELTKMWTVGNELRLLMQPVSTIVAGKPYLVKYNGQADDLTQMVFEGVTVMAEDGLSTVVEGATMYGILEPTLLEVDNQNILFLAAGNTLKWNATGSNLRAFRAYFDITGGPGFAPIHRGMSARIVEREEIATGIENAAQSSETISKYLENGMLIIEKNGVKYNAQGQIVK